MRERHVPRPPAAGSVIARTSTTRLGGRIRHRLERLQPRQLILSWRVKRILRIWIRLWPIILRTCVDRLIGRVTSTGGGITTSRRSVFAACYGEFAEERK